MSQPVRMLIFAIAGAPYRDAFYQHLASRVGGKVVYAKTLASAPDHAWSEDKSERPPNFEEVLLPALSLKGRGWFRKWRQGRNPLVFPTFAFWHAVGRLNPEVVLIQEYSPVSLVLLLWAKFHRRQVFVMTEIGRSTADLGWITYFRHWIFGRFVDGQLAHTLAAREPIALRLSNVCFSPHAVEVSPGEPEKRPGDGRVRFLFVGNLIERKGVDHLLRAGKILVDRGYEGRFVFRLVGGGNTGWLQPDLDALGAHVELAGFREKEALKDEYRSADVFVLPSRFDTFGVVAHEAAAMGLALVLSSHAGSSELFGIQENAADIVLPEDEGALASTLAHLIDDPSARRARGKAAFQASHHWSVQANAERVANWLFASGAVRS